MKIHKPLVLLVSINIFIGFCQGEIISSYENQSDSIENIYWGENHRNFESPLNINEGSFNFEPLHIIKRGDFTYELWHNEKDYAEGDLMIAVKRNDAGDAVWKKVILSGKRNIGYHAYSLKMIVDSDGDMFLF